MLFVVIRNSFAPILGPIWTVTLEGIVELGPLRLVHPAA